MVKKTGARRVVLVGHDECLVNNVPYDVQCGQVDDCVTWYSRVIWEDEDGNAVEVEIVGLMMAKTAQNDEDHQVAPFYGWKADWRN